mgnify:CR=1 FL=1
MSPPARKGRFAMSEPLDLDALEELAKKATPGPWRWWGQVKGPMSLVSKTPGLGTPFVMGFKRLGMRDAQPTFATGRDITKGWGGGGLMTPASETGYPRGEDGALSRLSLLLPEDPALNEAWGEVQDAWSKLAATQREAINTLRATPTNSAATKGEPG